MKKQLIGIITSVIIISLLNSCQKDEPEELSEAFISSFSVNSYTFDINNNLIEQHIDKDIDKTKLIAVFDASGVITVNNVVQKSGVTATDFSKPTTYTVTNSDGVSRQYVVRLTTFTGLPKLYITTDNGTAIDSKDEYVGATIQFDPNCTDDSTPFEITGDVKGRGNSTWVMPKKSYKLKLNQKTSFLGEPAHKEWILQANYMDKTLIRNYLAMDLSRKMDMPYTPCAHFVELFVNNQHVGNYLLTDQIEVSSSRVDIEEQESTDTDPAVISGGWILEIDQPILEHLDEPYFETDRYPITIKYPKNPNAAQMTYIKQYFWDFEYTLYTSGFADPINGFRKYVDEETMIKWFIVNEVFKNVDAQRYSSIYMYKDRNKKLKMGPVWDFDLSTGNAFHNNDCMVPTGWYVMYNAWFKRMYEDPAFQQRVKAIWVDNRYEIYQTLDLIDKLVTKINKSQAKNFTLWPQFEDPYWAVVKGKNSYLSQISWLKSFMTERIDWMDAELSQ